MIYYGKQSIDQSDIDAVLEVLKSDWLTQGPAVSRFESALAEYCGAKYAVVVSNGTVALHLACLALDIKKGDEGITSPITFAASANCLLYCNATPKLADIEWGTWNISPDSIAEKITERTKVIIPVDFAGLPAELEEIRKIADMHNLAIIEDACHALGAEYKGRKIGGTGYADMVVFSFHPVKHITTGEGGAIVTDDAVLAKKLRQLRHHGITKDKNELKHNDGPWYYEIQSLGYNARITDFQCALGWSQLKKIDGFIKRRNEIAVYYRNAFKNIAGLTMQKNPKDRSNSHHLFVIHLEPKKFDRYRIFEHLNRNGVKCQVHYIPLYKHPYYQEKCSFVKNGFPNAEKYYRGALSIPIYSDLSSESVSLVIELLHEVTEQSI